MEIEGYEIDISHRDKVFFPGAGLTKGDLIDYYQSMAETMLPHMRRYGVSMQRFPDGLDGDGFFNKDAPDYFPAWIRTVRFPKREGGSFDAPVVDTKAALVYLANQAMITPHLYLAPADDLEHPDRMIYDLDPPEGSEDFAAVRRAALLIRDLMTELQLEARVQTTGSKGFHVVVPLDGSADFDEVRRFAHDAAALLVRRHERRFTLELRKNKRQGRIFLDVLRNSYGATAVAPYAVRARPGAPVATPVDWQEIEAGASPRGWTMQTIPRRLAHKRDPWSGPIRAYAVADHRRRLDQLLAVEPRANEERE